jgi:peptide/nickel transport system permease protein
MESNAKKARNQSYWGGVFHRLRQNKRAMVALIALAIMVLGCILVPIFSPYAMEQTNTADGDLAPGGQYLFGTDKIGRDLFTRLFYGGRISLGIALAVTACQAIIGVVLGCISGFYGGVADAIIMRLGEVFYSFPMMMMAITMVSLLPSKSSIINLIVTLTVLSWPGIARIVRGQILTLREQEYMEACEALGISDFRRIFRHLLPNVLAYVIVYATMGMASSILVETSLSFLGMGISPPTPTWGNMINEAKNLIVIINKWWIWIPPSICIFVTVMCFNLLGDGLRDAIDPKMQR